VEKEPVNEPTTELRLDAVEVSVDVAKEPVVVPVAEANEPVELVEVETSLVKEPVKEPVKDPVAVSVSVSVSQTSSVLVEEMSVVLLLLLVTVLEAVASTQLPSAKRASASARA
jgi:hypothetical protein